MSIDFQGGNGGLPMNSRRYSDNSCSNNPFEAYRSVSDTSKKGYLAYPIDATVNSVTYKHNIQEDTMELESFTSKGKVKIKELSNGFYITEKVENRNYLGEIVFTEINYFTKYYSGIAIVPGRDYVSGKYDKYFDGVKRYPGCSKAELNALIGFKLKTTQTKTVLIQPHQGINILDNGDICFGGNNHIPKEIERFVSLSVLKRKKLTEIGSKYEVMENWKKVFSCDPTICFLSNLYLVGALKYFFDYAGFHFNDFLCIKPSSKPYGLTNEKLKAMLSTNDYHKYSIPTLNSSEKMIENTYSEVYDGVFLIEDVSFADEEEKIIDGLKTTIRCVQNESIPGRNITMIISPNAGYIAAKLAPQNAVIIDTNGINFDYTADEIEHITNNMTSLVYKIALNNPERTKEYISNSVHSMQNRLSDLTSGKQLEMLAEMMTIELFLYEFLGLDRVTYDQQEQYLKIINNKGEKIMRLNTLIQRELGAVLSEGYRAKKYRFQRKQRNFCLNDDGKTGVFMGNRLLISAAMISSAVDVMESVNSVESVIAAFKNDGALICTDGDTHPFDSHDVHGKFKRLYFYDIPAEILDQDVLYALQNLGMEEFMLEKSECQIPGFMPLIIGKQGKIAGTRHCFQEANNENVVIYGQSGEGKSYTMCQIMANRLYQGYEVWVFDTSDSFTYEALCENLSEKYVKENVIMYRLDDNKLNYDLFKINRNTSLPSQKKELLGLITAGIGDLSVPQTNMLRSKISELLEVTDADEPISLDTLMTLLDEEGNVCESLRNRLDPFFEDIKEYGLTGRNEISLFGNDIHKIHIIQISDVTTVNGNQIVDAMLAHVFNYQRENPQHPLSVFIDEVQNHNMSVFSPIRKIMKEGRKQHLSIVCATQEFYARSTDIGATLGKADMQIIHRPTQDSINLVAAELRWKKSDIARFDSMERGDVIIKGPIYSKQQSRNIRTIISGHIYDFPAI